MEKYVGTHKTRSMVSISSCRIIKHEKSSTHRHSCNNHSNFKCLQLSEIFDKFKRIMTLPTIVSSSSTTRLFVMFSLLYVYSSVVMLCLFRHHIKKIREEDFSPYRLFLQETDDIEEKCSKHPSWSNDETWKKAILDPQLCGISPPTDDGYLNDTTSTDHLLLLFNETMFNYSHYTHPPCGQYCIYPLQSIYSYSYGQPVLGYSLQSSPDDPEIKCWKPFTSQYENIPCGKQHYDEWINIMEPYVATDFIPAYECRSRNHSHTGGILSTAKTANGEWSDGINRDNHCDGIRKINEFVLEEKTKQFRCTHIMNPMNLTTFEKMQRWLTTTSENRKSEQHRSITEFRNKTKSRLLIQQSSPFCSKEILKLSNPSDIVHLYDSNQLGLHYLSDAMTIYNYNSGAHTNSSLASRSTCKGKTVRCIYHEHSIPSDSNDSHHSLKGWVYSTLNGCVSPIVDMKNHPVCGVSSEQYLSWSKQMIEKRSKSSFEKSSSATGAKCDHIPASSGRYLWDFSAASNQAIFVPPNDTYTEEICGPRILFVGSIKCGAHTLPPLLARHPRVKLNLCPDSRLENCSVKYFQGDFNNYTHGIETIWGNNGLSHGYMSDPINYVGLYARKLPIIKEGDREITIDVSPTYINTETFPNIAQRTYDLLPNAKIVVNVCDPATRMYADFDKLWYHQSFEELFYQNHHVRSPNDFDEYVEDMDEESNNCKGNGQFCYELRRDRLNTGRYIDHIRHWQGYYGSENVLVLNMEDSNEHNLKQIFKLMGDALPDNEYPWQSLVPANENEKNVKKQIYGNYKKAFDWLYKYFEESNSELAKEINEIYPLLWKP